MAIHVKRIYEPASKGDGYRILVDRLWPRGIKKEDAEIDQWMKEIAPSTDLRKWFHEGKGTWEEFRKKYLAELKESGAVDELRANARKHKALTLLYASKDEEHNHALVLKDLLAH
ncbi:MAG TPA: DUF488 domain-containing protein [Chitinophaga sp.]|uniref:DUF488 domain-containing protein n=1 Tax=Chitinophaga sp. TaxID=1869181 RepID=UPI002DBB66F3|nr:DUF488 domain-containing protein [Chitinophaga sp.]HEU4553881.1 DUF488 domain-containing protein [Chitinophaga sp.]